MNETMLLVKTQFGRSQPQLLVKFDCIKINSMLAKVGMAWPRSNDPLLACFNSF